MTLTLEIIQSHHLKLDDDDYSSSKNNIYTNNLNLEGLRDAAEDRDLWRK